MNQAVKKEELQHKSYLPARVNGNLVLSVSCSGQELIRNPLLNKGSAFTREERINFGLDGILPPHILGLKEQILQIKENFFNKIDDIEKYIFLRSLQDRNETLFYAFCREYILDVLPIIYTPTVGEAVKKYGNIFRFSRGLFITPYNVDRLDNLITGIPSMKIEMIVVTDSQGVLGIGDQGVGGMAISIGKLSIYTLAAGFHPSVTLPIVLDVGTDNEKLLNDPMYLGLRQKRITGKEYDSFIKKFAYGIKRNFPDAVLQWEDFSKQNAFNNMDRFKDVLPSFNDDIEGTAAVTVGGILGAMKIKKEKIGKQKFMIYGAGAAGVGIARQILYALMNEGLDEQDAKNRIFLADSKGLVLASRKNLDEYKKEFALDPSVVANWTISSAENITMAEVIREAGITTLIGVSGQANSFTNEIVQLMMKNTDRPVIFPLSNPTSHSERDPREILKITNCKAIVAAGSPYDSVKINGKEYEIPQGNNAFIFPGVGLGAVVAKAKKISPQVFTVAAQALADSVTNETLAKDQVYPSIEELYQVTVNVAQAVSEQCVKEGNSMININDIETLLREKMWHPEYPALLKDQAVDAD